MVCDQNICQNIWRLLTYSLSLHTKLIIMAKREYVRHIVAYKDYFKDFKKELPRKVIEKIYQVFIYIMTLEMIPNIYLKSIEGVRGLYEIRNDMIMDKKDTKKLQLTPVEDMITEDFGKEGTSSRMEFEAGVDAFILGEKLKEERIKAGLTQEQLAARIGTKKTYISRVENGHADIQMSTLFKIFHGLGRKVSFTIL